MNTCLFDIDGTLLSSGGAGKAAMEVADYFESEYHRVSDHTNFEMAA